MAPFPVRFVLLRPRNPENVGAVARALKNFGFEDWSLVEPAPFVRDGVEARRLAVHSGDVLTAARHEPLDAALARCAWVVGTTSRRVRGRARLTPREVAERVAERRSEGPVALVFGDERNGLRNEDLRRCHDLSAIPASAAQPSFNLAQAVLLYAYELARTLGDADAARASSKPLKLAASEAERGRLEALLGEVLRDAGFLGRGGDRHALDDLVATLRRARLTRSEGKLWSAALHGVRRALRAR